MKYLVSAIAISSMLLAAVPALAAWNISASIANTGFNQNINLGTGANKIHTGKATTLSGVANVASNFSTKTVNVSVAAANTGANHNNGGSSGANTIHTGSATAGSVVVNFESNF